MPPSSTATVATNSNSETAKADLDKISVLPKMIFQRHEEYMYLRMVEDIISSGSHKDDRTGTGTLSKFGCQVNFNCSFWRCNYFVILLSFFLVHKSTVLT